MSPTSEGYSGLFSQVRGYMGLELSRKPENEDIYRLLSIREHGYMNIHDKPFTYYRELLPLAEQLEKVTQSNPPACSTCKPSRNFPSK